MVCRRYPPQPSGEALVAESNPSNPARPVLCPACAIAGFAPHARHLTCFVLTCTYKEVDLVLSSLCSYLKGVSCGGYEGVCLYF